MIEFHVKAQDARARRGTLRLRRGIIETPQFMPVGTKGAVKSLRPDDLVQAGTSVILVNTYHLYIRPGLEVINQFQGIHRFMNWSGPVLSDSGGFQIFSMSNLTKLTEEGVFFSTPEDGGLKHFISPEFAVEIQEKLDSDIAMCFDECTPYPSTCEETKKSMELSLRWARRCQKAHNHPSQSLWGIIQGGMEKGLREISAMTMNEMNFEGYAIGGMGVGEDKSILYDMIRYTAPLMPANKPRYLMGIGTPGDIVEAVSAGIDLFDCVIPTRNARHGKFYTSEGIIRIKNARFKKDTSTLDRNCTCYCCKNFSRSYLHHLILTEEVLGSILASIHNIHYYLNLMKNIRESIEAGKFLEFRESFYRDQKILI